MLFDRALSTAFLSLSLLTGTVHAINGRATWYYAGLGACGGWNVNSDYIVALPTVEYAGGVRCGKKIKVHYKGKTITAKVVDLCPTCGLTGIDLSPSAFLALEDLTIGVLQVKWEYI